LIFAKLAPTCIGLIIYTIDAARPLLGTNVALVVLEEVTPDALSADEVIDALHALLPVEVPAVVALVIAHLVVLRLALLLFK